MNKVSRSFALVTPSLEDPLNHYMATAYLVCRVVDNIEDSQQPFDWQSKRFAEFVNLLHEPDRARDILQVWGAEDWPGLTADERNLMGLDGLKLWQIFSRIPPQSRLSIAQWAIAMAEGMEQMRDPNQAPFLVSYNGVELPAKEEDYNQYCYYVAGTVGHMSTELIIDFYGLKGEVTERLLANSEACGRGLQKTNIVKDFAEDLPRGICYLPDEWMDEVGHRPMTLSGAPLSWKRKILDDVLRELDDSTAYILDLPYNAAGHRKASLLVLLPAYQTILLAAKRHEKLFTPKHKVKISRRTMYRCLQDAKALVGDNEAILEYSRQIRKEVDKAIGN